MGKVKSYDDYRAINHFSESILQYKTACFFNAPKVNYFGNAVLPMRINTYVGEELVSFHIWALNLGGNNFRHFNTQEEAETWRMLHDA